MPKLSMNKKLKKVLGYLPWILLSYIIAFVYMSLLTGRLWGNVTGIDVLLDRFFFFGMLPIVMAIGTIIALLFILTDIFYIKTKLAALPNKIAVRFSYILLITFIVFFCHYYLEKVIDII